MKLANIVLYAYFDNILRGFCNKLKISENCGYDGKVLKVPNEECGMLLKFNLNLI